MSNDYEKNRITGHKDVVCNQAVEAISRLLHMAAKQMDNPPEKMVLCVGAAIPPLSGIGVMMTEFGEDENPEVEAELITIGTCYVLASAEDHPEGMAAGYSIDTVIRAFEIYEKLMGRKYANPNKFLVEAVERRRTEIAAVSQSVPVHLSKFMPN